MTADPPRGDQAWRRDKGQRVRWAALAVVALTAVVAGVGAVALSVAVTQSAAATPTSSGCAGGQPKLTVQGAAQVSDAPDIATVSVTISTVGSSAADALGANNTAAGEALAAFKSGGVTAHDIVTSGLSLSPNYIYPNGVAQLNGYGATNSITATLRHLATAGTVIDAVSGSAGDALRINSLSFSRSDPVRAEDQARSEAVAQAASHARAMASAAGRTLGAVCSLIDQTPLPTSFSASGDLRAASGSAAPNVTPIEPGTESESAQVEMTYALEASGASEQR